MSEQQKQIAKLAGVIVEYQVGLEVMSTDDRRWAIQNMRKAIGLFATAVRDRNAKKVQKATRVITLNHTTIAVNLAITPKLPFNGAEVESHTGIGWAIVEKRDDGLYVNGRKVVLSLSKGQQSGDYPTGYDLREELGKLVQNANLLDALYKNTHLIPKYWKRDSQDRVRFIHFWGTIYRNPVDDHLYVCYLYFGLDSGWNRRYLCLGSDFNGYHPAALLANHFISLPC